MNLSILIQEVQNKNRRSYLFGNIVLKFINDLDIAYFTQNNIKKFIERTLLNFHDRGSAFAMKGKVCCNLFII